jgi:L-fuconolactonase
MIIVDTHCHALPHWFEPVETLLHQMNANGVEKATLVQVRGQFDNRYIMECVQRFPGRFSAVAIVDTDRSDAPETLAHWVSQGAEGVRLSPTTRSPGSDPLAIWRQAAELGILVSCLGSADGLSVHEMRSDPKCHEHTVSGCKGSSVHGRHLGTSAQRSYG